MADPVLRIRQVCLLAHDLEWTTGMLTHAFDAPVVFQDPHMAAGGHLINTHIRLGDSFLETVCPLDQAWADRTTQARMLERSGDCGYMAIVQVPDVAAASVSMAAQGSHRNPKRGAFLPWGSAVHSCPGSPGSGIAGYKAARYKLGEPLPKEPGVVVGANVQFDPKVFGTLTEIQENWPGNGPGDFPRNKGAYFPAGNSWQNGVDARPHGGVTTGFAAVEIALRDGEPEEICGRWLRGLGAGCSVDPHSPTTLRLADHQTIRFVRAAPGGRTGVTAVDLWRAPGMRRKFHSIEICGVRWTLVDKPGIDYLPSKL